MPPAPIDEETLTQILKDAPRFSYCNNDYEKYLIEKGRQMEREKFVTTLEKEYPAITTWKCWDKLKGDKDG